MTDQAMGRPRDAAIDAAVLDAARDLLAEVGYARVTMDDTAARAGTSKASIYRRYPSKAELLFAAAVHRPEATVPNDTGTLRGDLLALARRIRTDMSTPAAREVAPHLIAEIARSPEVSARVRELFVAGERDEIELVLRRAEERGELGNPPPVATVHRMLGGALFFTVHVIGEEIDDDELARVVDTLVAGLR